VAEEFEERDLSGAVFWGVDLTGARFRDVNLTSVRISHARVVDVDIDALVDAVTINGVDVTQYVNEHDSWYPLRAMLRPTEPDGLRAAWEALQQAWDPTVRRAERLTEDQRHESVDGEWSFVQTLRHLVFAMDKWFTAPILGQPYHPIGLPNSGSAGFGWPGLDREADPTFAEALAVRAGRTAAMRDYLTRVTQAELSQQVEVLENGTAPMDECLFTVFEEEFEHNRYAIRDLEHFD
jgi:uncharacterized damage-inducible protein DinB